MHWFTKPVFDHYADFAGRTSRKAFWMFALIHILFTVIISVVGGVIDIEILVSIYALAIFLPALAISVRRLHDVDKSGWWVLLSLIPIVGFLVLLFFYIKPGDVGANQFGPNPDGVEVSTEPANDLPQPDNSPVTDVPPPPQNNQLQQ